jgi:hypothetical protein
VDDANLSQILKILTTKPFQPEERPMGEKLLPGYGCYDEQARRGAFFVVDSQTHKVRIDAFGD